MHRPPSPLTSSSPPPHHPTNTHSALIWKIFGEILSSSKKRQYNRGWHSVLVWADHSFTFYPSPNSFSTSLYPDPTAPSPRLHRLWFLVGLGQYEAIQGSKGQGEESFGAFHLPTAPSASALLFYSWLNPFRTIAPPQWTPIDSVSSARLQVHVPSLLLSVLRVVMTFPGAILGSLSIAYRFP